MPQESFIPDGEALKTAASAVGAITGTVALLWRIADEFGSFLRISLKVEEPKDDWTTALTTIENKGYRNKKILYTFLLVGPESESPVETAQAIAKEAQYKGNLKHLNDLGSFRVSQTVATRDRAIIPLPFYYSENVAIGDETLTYRAPVSLKGFASAAPYAVRFFLFGPGRLHRTTQDTFIIEKPKAEASTGDAPAM
ncbi:MAG: hypothetical protein JOZ08_00465 [Verrucomicrobia bacterium]|nr:hypothetical protein [Verrucomicrobiota bacterium]MBV8277473.1 hypothetical protein [Verrucomicrobiota bacterium]